MSPRRPPRAWVGEPVRTDPGELAGPRGLTREVLDGSAMESDEGRNVSPDFYWSLMSEARRRRIESVVDARLKSVTVITERLIDPHNVAAILRTSEGLGLAKVHVVPHEGQDALAHRRVTQDAEKWLDVEVHKTACVAALRAQGFRVFAGHLDAAARLYTELPADAPIALLFGSEHEGPSPEALAECDGAFRIPMAGFTQSFNVSVAAGIALAHVARARRECLGAPGDLTEEERVLLRRRFTLLASKLQRRLAK